ncbi:MAG TPA: hypothetical protein VGP41_05990 [Candidatus Lustribacter sp.]|jgi:hypothetical protein|nr:hypothetical protein [Candidatus Lustribacter sp.]
MRRFLGVALAAIVAGLAAIPAAAADSTDVATLKAMMKAADANVHSVQTQMSTMGVSSVFTVLTKPLREHMQMASGPMAMEMYVADGFIYMRIANGPWQKHSIPSLDSMVSTLRTFTDTTQVTLDPDVVEDGRSYGVFEMQTPTVAVPGVPPAPAMTMTCTYDKQTYLRHECKTASLTMTFRYNDPSDVVVLPPDAAAATDAGPFPFPIPSPP